MTALTDHGGPLAADDEAPSVLEPSGWVERYSDYLFRYALSRLRDQNAAEEVVQETFLSGVRYAEQFSGRGTERAWLLGILKRKLIDFIRRRNKHASATPYEDETDLTSQLFDAGGNWKSGGINWSIGPGHQIEMSELMGIVKGCLTKLPQSQADVFTLSVIEEMESADICEQLGISSSNFWVRMHRARLGLATCVNEKWEGK